MAYLESSWKDCKMDTHVIQTSIQWIQMSTINDTAVCGDNFVVTEMKYAASNCVLKSWYTWEVIPTSESSVNMVQNQ
jgi:hypothetical protein